MMEAGKNSLLASHQRGVRSLESTQTTAVALMRRDGSVLLVRQQRLEDEDSVWALPGGRSERGELLTETLMREVREETDLDVTSVADLVCVAQIDNSMRQSSSLAEISASESIETVFFFTVLDWQRSVDSSDPDGAVLQTRFIDEPEAIELLRTLPVRFMREPVVAYLEGRVPAGTIWLYRYDAQGEEELMSMVVGNGPPVGKVEARSRSSEAKRAAPSFQASMFVLGCMGILFLLGIILVIGIISAVH